MKPRIKSVIQGVHMGLGHDGLQTLLKKNLQLDLRKLEDGELVMCINKLGDKMKIIGGRGRVLGYLKLPNKERIAFDALQYIPQTFGGDGLNYDAACKKMLERRFAEYPQAKGKPPGSAQDRSARVA
jgi:hypothetical protein